MESENDIIVVHSGDSLLDVMEMITCLTSIYEGVAEDHPALVNVPLCVDLALNWLLNVYDR